jgi:hypothetical protein
LDSSAYRSASVPLQPVVAERCLLVAVVLLLVHPVWSLEAHRLVHRLLLLPLRRHPLARLLRADEDELFLCLAVHANQSTTHCRFLLDLLVLYHQSPQFLRQPNQNLLLCPSPSPSPNPNQLLHRPSPSQHLQRIAQHLQVRLFECYCIM